MNRSFILLAIGTAGTIVWADQARKIHEARARLGELAQVNSEVGHPNPGGRPSSRPFPVRTAFRRDAGLRMEAPEKRERPAMENAPVAARFAGELADLMGLETSLRTKVLPLLEAHIHTRRNVISALLRTGTISTEDHSGFQAAARSLNSLSTGDIDPMLDERSRKLLHSEDARQRSNAVMLLADQEYSWWKMRLGFPGIEQEACDVFYDLAEFRLKHPLPEGFSPGDLAVRLRDERSFISESLGPVLGEEKARSLDEIIAILADGTATSDR